MGTLIKVPICEPLQTFDFIMQERAVTEGCVGRHKKRRVAVFQQEQRTK
jgi:hypothetical protein